MSLPPTGSSTSQHALRSWLHFQPRRESLWPLHPAISWHLQPSFCPEVLTAAPPAAARCCERPAPLITARRLQAHCSGSSRILPGGPAAQGSVQRAWINRRYTARTKHGSLWRGGTRGIRAAGRQALCAPLNELENTIGFPGCENRLKDRGVTWLLGDPGIDLFCPQGPSISLQGWRPGFASSRKTPSGLLSGRGPRIPSLKLKSDRSSVLPPAPFGAGLNLAPGCGYPEVASACSALPKGPRRHWPS